MDEASRTQRRSIFARLFPGLAARRSQNLLRLETLEAQRQIMATTFRAAQRRVSDPEWTISSPLANSIMQTDLRTMTARARQSVRDESSARAVKHSYQRNVVGGGGITIQSTAKSANGTPDLEFRRQLNKQFKIWTRKVFCDTEHRRSFRRIQKWIEGELIESGEAFVHVTYERSQRGRPCSLKLQCFESEQLATNLFQNSTTRNYITAGVEVGSKGEPIAYWIETTAEDALQIKVRDPVRIPASQMLHIYDPERVLQARGNTRLSAVLTTARDLSEYRHMELWNARVQSYVGLIIKRSRPGQLPLLQGPTGSSDTDDQGNQLMQMYPGFVMETDETEEVQPFAPDRPGPQYETFTKECQQQIGAGSGISSDQVTMDFTKHNYSSLRQGNLENRKSWEDDQLLIIEDFCEPVWRTFVTQSVLEAQPGTDFFDSIPEDFWERVDDYTDAKMVPPGWSWVDPLKEVSAQKMAKEEGFTTLTRILGSQGETLEGTIEELKMEQEALEASGLEQFFPGSGQGEGPYDLADDESTDNADEVPPEDLEEEETEEEPEEEEAIARR